jgi:hypothetical protein
MLKFFGLLAVIWAMFHFGIAQLIAIWGMVALSFIANI